MSGRVTETCQISLKAVSMLISSMKTTSARPMAPNTDILPALAVKRSTCSMTAVPASGTKLSNTKVCRLARRSSNTGNCDRMPSAMAIIGTNASMVVKVSDAADSRQRSRT